ncbi:MAG: alpha-L-fucosidase [Chitinophagaceae bacterium]|nr:alpha-L-fucosidase [Chitinophagaceae bacterium]
MSVSRFYFFPVLFVTGLFFSCSTPAPEPFGPLPSERQLHWQEMEMYTIIHFTPTTFQNKEWGFGDADPAIFNPVDFNADSIVAAIKAGGFKGITFVAKHHDGFCLWPTSTTDYNISKTPFRDGKGDMVKEMEEAARRAGLEFGIYCSPWDRNNEFYSTPKYVTDVYYPQLRELYKNYGPLFTVFFDGANGGDGYYGGSNEMRKINASEYYQFDTIWNIVRTLQPTAAIFSDIGPDIRWVGNEKGEAAPTSWATLTPISPEPGKAPAPGFTTDTDLPGGMRDGKYWIPAECDVPLRPGWFYHADQDDKVKTPQQLMEIYYRSVGRGASLDLGIAPMPNGKLSPVDIEHLKKFGEILQKTFAVNYAKDATVTTTNTRGKNKMFAAQNLIDDDRYSYWATDDDVTTPEVTLTWKEPVEFNVIRLRENIKLGQRIEEVAIDIFQNGEWKQIAEATSIGGNRLIRLPENVTTTQLRLRVMKSPVCVVLSDLGVFREGE